MASPGEVESLSGNASARSPLKGQGASATDITNRVGAEASQSSKQKPPKNPQADGKGSTPSNAELKKRAKEEKAARRAKEKHGKQTGGSDQLLHTPVIPSEPGEKQPANVAPNVKHQKRRGSTTGNTKQQLPIRTSEAPVAISTAAPKKDSKNVTLFSHLYGQPRRTTIAGAGKDIHPTVVTLGLKMSHYIICGSNARCVAMLLAFKRVIDSYSTPPGNSLPRHLTTHLSSQIEYLVSCRPLSVSMGNAIRRLKVKISDIDPDTLETNAKLELCEEIDSFIQERITVAGQAIAASATDRIQDGDVVLTFAKSSTIEQTLTEALNRGKRFRVVVADSRPLFEGKILARRLVILGIEVQYCLLHAINHAIKDVTKVLLGAHGMTSNGRLYSRCGTALVAMAAKEANLPVIVCCESVKFSDKVPLDSIVMNEIAPPDELLAQHGDGSSPLSKWRDTPNLQLLNLMYDLTPAEYIDMVITEYGSLPPSSVPVVHSLSMNT